jgi:hypothetical protein
MHLMKSGIIVIDSVITGRWEALEREETILNACAWRRSPLGCGT